MAIREWPRIEPGVVILTCQTEGMLYNRVVILPSV